MIGVFVPANMTIFIGDSKFTPGRIAIVLLLVPALVVFFREGRRRVVPDLFVCAASAWMVGATILTGRSSSISSSVAEVLEFAGSYVIVRAYIFGRPALYAFVQALKIVAIMIILFALLEHLAGDYLVGNTVAALWGDPGTDPDFRNGLLRARSTFPHPILYGTFCSVAGAIFLYSETRNFGRTLCVGFCFVGCVLAVSSAPLISFAIAIFVFCYDCAMRRWQWRWKLLTTIIGVGLLAVFSIANRPTSWLIANLTLDPSTGYFRQATWDRAFYNIGVSPLTGYGFGAFGDPNEFFDNASIDSVWLVLALRFGVPVVIFVLLASVTSFLQLKRRVRAADPFLENMRTAFTLVLVIFAVAGLTVHFWHSIWIFWGMCIGIRANLRETRFDSVDFAGHRNGKQGSGIRLKRSLRSCSRLMC
jgi:O-antigen ligase